MVGYVLNRLVHLDDRRTALDGPESCSMSISGVSTGITRVLPAVGDRCPPVISPSKLRIPHGVLWHGCSAPRGRQRELEVCQRPLPPASYLKAPAARAGGEPGASMAAYLSYPQRRLWTTHRGGRLDETFRLGGMINPKIIVPVGSR